MLFLILLLSLCGCGGQSSDPASQDLAASEGKVFHIYAWNEEFKGFFEKYYAVPKGVTVKWTIIPNENGEYQQALYAALQNQDEADPDDRVDLFLAEADYILKFVNSDLTQDVKALGVTDFSNTYPYTVQAATDPNGVVKGVSFQCCPSALIYRRSIARDVLGTDDPEQVQMKLNSWEKFNSTAAVAKAKGYRMTASFAETYRVFSNNVTAPWVDSKNRLQMDVQIQAWVDQAEAFYRNGYTTSARVWDEEKKAEMFADGKTMCFFGPAWYYNFCMGNAQDPEKGCFGDWAICEGPQAHFWGGTWLLAPVGTDNPAMLADVMNTFQNDEEVCTKLVKNEMQFVNNQKVNNALAGDPSYGNEFLGGQNDTALFCELANDIRFENQTVYDQFLNESLEIAIQKYLLGELDMPSALAQFYSVVNKTCPDIITP